MNIFSPLRAFALLLVTLLLLTGCIAPGGSVGGRSYVWYRPDTTDEQMRRDLAHSRMETLRLHPQSQPAPPAPLPLPGQYDTGAIYRGMEEGNRQAQEEARSREYFRACMESKGYVWRRITP